MDGSGRWVTWASRPTAIAVLLMCINGAAWAQVAEQAQASEPEQPRRLMEIGYFNLGVAFQSGGGSFSERVRPTEKYGEAANFRTHHTRALRGMPDVALGLRLWRNLALGVGATYLRVRDDVELTGIVPHPLFYGRPRDLSVQVGDYFHTQVGIHAHAVWTVPFGRRFDVALLAGPSLFLVKQDRVSEVVVTLPGPTHNEFGAETTVTSVGERAFGANAGIDVTYHFFRQLDPGARFWTAGVGFSVRWTGATVGIAGGVDSLESALLEVGGLQYSAGLRFRF